MNIHIPAFEKAKILIIGDVMLDRYWHGGTQRISAEAPVPVVHVNSVEECPGGAANVALNIKALTAQPILTGIIGEDAAGSILTQRLNDMGIQHHLQATKKHPTITKLRVISLNQQLIRLDFEQSFSDLDTSILFDNYLTYLREVKAVIISDYHKGTLHNIPALIAAAQQLNVPVFVDPKGANFSIYKGATVLTPNRKEFEAIVGSCKTEEELVNKGYALLKELNLGALIVTRGAEGMTLIRLNADPVTLAAHAHEVYDVTGAGDTVIAVLAAAVAAGEDIEYAMNLANIAAGIVVTKLGAANVTIPELRRALRKQKGSRLDVLTEEDAVTAVQDAKAHGETVVMTNGCFDILHAGHIEYLEEAKALGHRLLVAVNDDASVRRLKGNSRPINKLKERMRVLAALQSVDWVVPFSEDTPARLIELINPKVLVKGGDYKIPEIAGAEFVLAQGGAVKILKFVDGCSTSKIVKKITEEIL